MNRIYLDWNATAPLRIEARNAMVAAMDVLGNPSSVHAEGRAARAIVEKARAQVAALVGCDSGDLVFTSGATEAAHLVLSHGWNGVAASAGEHDAVLKNIKGIKHTLSLDRSGRAQCDVDGAALYAVAGANSETGVVNDLARFSDPALSDITQTLGKIDQPTTPARYLIGASHKIGGPKGVGFAVLKGGVEFHAIRGGGQEMGRRAGTENVVGIAGFGAAAAAARRDLDAGLWQRVATRRDRLETRLATECPGVTFIGRAAPRLPNTSCFALSGWKAETQVMQMDLAGCAVSAGSACSSGKVKASETLVAMGCDSSVVASAIRVSFGPSTTQNDLDKFADIWLAHSRRFAEKAA